MRKRHILAIARFLMGLACSSLIFGFPPSSVQADALLPVDQGWLPTSNVGYFIVGGFDAVAAEKDQLNSAMTKWTFDNTNLYNCSDVSFSSSGANPPLSRRVQIPPRDHSGRLQSVLFI
jgi:hypothetical protein